LPAFNDNAAAITGGLFVGSLYRLNTNPDVVCVVGDGTGSPISMDGTVIEDLPAFNDNAAAITGGLFVGSLYRLNTNPDVVCVVGDGTGSPISLGGATGDPYGATATDVKMNGVQAVGSISEIARIDHVHPIDTSRASYTTNTFTPVLNFGGATTGITYTTQTGQYTSIGNMTFCTISILLSNKGSATGTATITGLPVAAVIATSLHMGDIANIGLPTNGIDFACTVDSQTLRLRVTRSATTPLDLTDAGFANNSRIRLTFAYHTA